MCGLAGIFLHPQERSEEDWQIIRRTFSETLLSNEERGRDASGVALVRRDGTYRIFKQPVAASQLIEMPGYQALLAEVGPDTTCLLGHTRAPTKGSRWDNANNHPLLAGQVIGIHNGHIHNDDELFAGLSLPRQGHVDSEIIFRLLDTVEPWSRNGGYLTAVRQRMALLQGRFATLSVDLWHPERLLVLKQNVPLCVHYHAPWQALCFSSRYIFLRKAFGRSVITEALDPGYAYLFDVHHLPRQGKEPVDQASLSPSGSG
jgi:glucosamine 6-phosphate synthetase-like amidotransferase/phosphosugar isomerase protein